MGLHPLDWAIIAAYGVFALGVGVVFARRAGSGTEEYFLSGRRFPWWIVGTSMVATTFAADTPLAITEFVRGPGIWNNWFWWNLALVHLLAAFLFAPLWRRAKVLTDNELLELRYSGKPAAFLRGFKAAYFALPFNFIVLAWVLRAMTDVVHVLLGTDSDTALWICVGVALVYALLSGFWGVVLTDLVQFVIAMVGCIALAIFAVGEVGGLSSMMEQLEGAQAERARLGAALATAEPAALPALEAQLAEVPPVGPHTLDLFPPVPEASITSQEWWQSPFATVLVFLLLMWWCNHATDGGGYIIQRMSSAKNERHALLAMTWFNVTHYALRVWPWVLVALVSILLFPRLDAPELAGFSNLGEQAGYPLVMREVLGPGWTGVLVVTFLAAFMSTVDTHLNWGASYLIHDLYGRFWRPTSSFDSEGAAQRHYVRVSRITTVVLMVVAAFVSTKLAGITSAWGFIYVMGAGVGLVLMLRWFWWRVNAWSEIVALGTSLVLAVAFELVAFAQVPADEAYELFARNPVILGVELPSHLRLLAIVPLSMVAWISATFLTRPEPHATLRAFYERAQPGGAWGPIAAEVPRTKPSVTRGIVGAWFAGIALVYGLTFGIGNVVLGSAGVGIGLLALALVGFAWLWRSHLSPRSYGG